MAYCNNLLTPHRSTVRQRPRRCPRDGADWVSRRVTTNGVVSVAWQQVCVGAHYAGARCDIHVDGDLLRFWVGDQLVKTAARTSHGEVRNKRAFRTREQA